MANDLLLNILIKAQNQATPAFNAVSNALKSVNDTTLLSAQAALKLDGANASLAAAQSKVAIASDQAVIAIQKYQVMSADASISTQKLSLAADQASLAMAKVDQASVAAAAAQTKVADATLSASTAQQKAATGATVLKDAEVGLSGEGRILTGVIEGISGALDMIGGMIAISAISSLIGQFQNLGQTALGSSASLEQMKVGMQTLLPVGDQANQMLTKLYNFAAKTPFLFPDIERAAQRLMGVGYSAKATIPMITAMGDALSAAGNTSAAELQSVVAIFAKIQTQGKLTTIDINELGTHGINALGLLKDYLHVSTAKLQEMIKSGLLPAKVAARDLLLAMHGTSGGAMAKQATTFNGLMTTVKDNISLAWKAFSGPLFEKAKQALQGVADLVASSGFKDSAAKMGKDLGKGITMVMPIVKELGKVFGDLGQEIRPYLVQLQAWIVKNHVVQIAVAMVVLTIRGLGAVLKFLIPIIAAIIVAVAKFVGTIVARLQPTLAALQAFWKAHWLQIQAILFGVWNAILGIIKTAWATISGIFLIFIDILTGNWKGLWTDLKNMLGGMWSGIVQAVGGGLQALINTVILYADPIFTALVKPFYDGYNAIAALLGMPQVAIPTLSGLIGPVSFMAPNFGSSSDGSAVSKKKAGKAAADASLSIPADLSNDPTSGGGTGGGGTGSGRGGHHGRHGTGGKTEKFTLADIAAVLKDANKLHVKINYHLFQSLSTAQKTKYLLEKVGGNMDKFHQLLKGVHRSLLDYINWNMAQKNKATNGKKGTLIIDEPDGSTIAISGTWTNGVFKGSVFRSDPAKASSVVPQAKLSGTHHTTVHHHHVTNIGPITITAKGATGYEVYKEFENRLSKELRRSGNYASGTSKAA